MPTRLSTSAPTSPTKCADTFGFKDKGNYACSAWTGYSCSTIAVTYSNYNDDDQAAVIANCPLSCGLCGSAENGSPPSITSAPVATPVVPAPSSSSCALSLNGCVASVGSGCATAIQHTVKCQQIKCSGQFSQHCADQSAVLNVKLTMGGSYKTTYDISADCGSCGIDSSPVSTRAPTRTPTHISTRAPTRSFW
jgi:hypothetical protein